MNWEAMGAIGETLGAIGVIVTLIYLASQLRQNTKTMRSSTYQTYAALAMNISDYLAEHAEIFAKLGRAEELSDAEQMQHSMYSMKMFYQMETTFLHYQEGAITQDIFESRMRGFQKAWDASPLMPDAWKEFRDWDLSDEFVQFAEEHVIAKAGARL